MTAKIKASSDGLKVTIGNAAEDALEINQTAKTIKGINGYSMDALPSGMIIDYGGAAIPAGFLLCNGAAVSRTIYAALFAALGTEWGVGDGSTTFNVPNFEEGEAAVATTAAGTLADVTVGAVISHTHPTGSIASGSAGGSSWGNNAPLNSGWVTATQAPSGAGAKNLAAGRKVFKLVKI